MVLLLITLNLWSSYKHVPCVLCRQVDWRFWELCRQVVNYNLIVGPNSSLIQPYRKENIHSTIYEQRWISGSDWSKLHKRKWCINPAWTATQILSVPPPDYQFTDFKQISHRWQHRRHTVNISHPSDSTLTHRNHTIQNVGKRPRWLNLLMFVAPSTISCTSWEIVLTHIASGHCPFNISFKQLWVVTEDSCCFMVQRILIVWLRKKKVKAINNSVDVENRLPIFTQNVQAYISFQINIWMVYLGLALHLWRFMRIRGRDLKSKDESAT